MNSIRHKFLYIEFHPSIYVSLSKLMSYQFQLLHLENLTKSYNKCIDRIHDNLFPKSVQKCTKSILALI